MSGPSRSAATKLLYRKTPTCLTGRGAPGTSPTPGWCPRADELFGVEGVHLLDVRPRRRSCPCRRRNRPETHLLPRLRVVAIGHGRRVQWLHDAPCLGGPVRVRWFKRIWRCPEASWSADVDRAAFIRRAPGRAHRPGHHPGGRCAAPRRHHGLRAGASARVAWDTCWNANAQAAKQLVKPRPSGVDGHIWRPSKVAAVGKAGCRSGRPHP